MKAKELLKQMTLEEKIGQLVQPYGKQILRCDPETDEPVRDPIQMTDEERARVGSVLDNSFVDGTTRELKAFLSEEIGGQIPLLAMHDVIHGCDTIFPISLGLACAFEPELMRESARIAGEEARAHNIHVVFAPMADQIRDARWGRVMEAVSEDPLLNREMTAAAVNGFHDAGIACCVKHFAAYGLVEAGRDYNAVQVGERMLREQMFSGYRAAVDAGVDMIMTSYNTVNDVPATASTWLMRDILREEWGFDGIIISDSGAINELVKHGYAEDRRAAALAAIKATVDIDMSSDCYLRNLKDLIESGEIDEAAVDAACLRVLQLKERLGVLDNPIAYPDPAQTKRMILKPEYLESAKRCAERSAVLLKNDNVLPLAKKTKRLALIGPFADAEEILGNWLCFGPKQYGKGVISTVKLGIAETVPECEIVHVPGCGWALDDETADFSEAVQAAQSCDAVVLCLGEYQLYSGEGNSRTDIGLPTAQLRLAQAVCAVNQNTAVVLFCGRPLTIPELDAIAPAILCMWQPGTAGGRACASLLFGDAVPSGKLTASWPRSVGQLPLYYNHTRTGRPCWSKEVEKRRSMTSNYLDEFTSPLYPFGYGLSYTSFSFADARLSSDTLREGGCITLSVRVKNTGTYTGSEVVQLYIRDHYGSVVRPVLELKDYKKIELAPDEETTVEFEINEPMLRFIRQDMTFGSEKGLFTAMIGSSSHRLQSLEFSLV